ncbi:hypothetical protein BH09VER1_BH09VER1_04550 [soil metagenome]
MRNFFIALFLCILVIGCKKKPTAAAEADAAVAAAPTPSATPEPTPTPKPIVDLTSQAIVLCYHRFEDKPKDSLALKPADFEAQMQALKDNGIEVIPMADLLAWRRGEKSIPPKSAVVTIDDGYLSGYAVAWPILKKFGYPFTMFIYTEYVKGGKLSGGQSITWAQLEEMRDAGVDIESHTVSHSRLNAKMGKNDQQYQEWLANEIGGSKKILEDKLGIQIKVIAYPYGINNEVVRKVVDDAGYEAAFTVYGQRLAHDAKADMLGRYAIESTNPKVFEEAVNFRGAVEGSQGGGSEASAIPASAAMITIPEDGSTIADLSPAIKINLAALGDIDPKSVTMRLSGLGLVPANFDPATKLLSYKLTQKLTPKQPVTVIVSAKAGNRKLETRWSFTVDPTAAAAPAATP